MDGFILFAAFCLACLLAVGIASFCIVFRTIDWKSTLSTVSEATIVGDADGPVYKYLLEYEIGGVSFYENPRLGVHNNSLKVGDRVSILYNPNNHRDIALIECGEKEYYLLSRLAMFVKQRKLAKNSNPA